MKRNAILIATIAFITGCAHQQGSYSEADYDRDHSYSAVEYDAQPVTTENLPRDPDGRIATSADTELNVQAQGSAAGSEIQADSSERGTSLRARGIELTDTPTQLEAEGSVSSSTSAEIQADSSKRGARMWQAQRREDESGQDLAVEGNLNASDELEENMTGEYDLDARMEAEASGTAASSEMDTGHSGELQPDLPESDLPPSDADRLYRSNPAHGVGSLTAPNTAAGVAATTEIGQEQLSGQSLAGRVKKRLALESTGTHGVMRHQVVRNVEVSAEGGVVTLTGTVPSQQDKDILSIRAREVPGVEEVKNELKVDPSTDPAQRDLSRD